MACKSCNNKKNKVNNIKPEEYDITGGVDIRSLNSRQIQVRLEVFKRRFCRSCSFRYDCTYLTYIDCKGTNPR